MLPIQTKLSRVFFILFFFVCSSYTFSVPLDSCAYSFLNCAKNRIENDSALAHFFNELHSLENKKNSLLEAIHFGDSHVQADLFTGRLRILLQEKFGNAGIGIAIPHQLAKSNQSYLYKYQSKNNWTTKRITRLRGDDSLQWGQLSLCSDSVVELLFKCKAKRANVFFIANHYKVDLSSLVNDTLWIRATKQDTTKCSFQLNAIKVYDGDTGIVYSAIGFNGAEYKHYVRNKDWQKVLSPQEDLYVFSLGANEANAATIDTAKFILQVDSLLQQVRQANPKACILITGPGDGYRKNKIKNYNNLKITQVLRSYCIQHNIAFYDWLTVMGGVGSAAKWQKVGLARPDKIHLSKKGYELQADMLYIAIMNAYQKYYDKH